MSLSAKLVALVEATEELMPCTANTNRAASLHVRRKKKSARPSMNIQCEILTTLERALLEDLGMVPRLRFKVRCRT
jgi:hypothetical protein